MCHVIEKCDYSAIPSYHLPILATRLPNHIELYTAYQQELWQWAANHFAVSIAVNNSSDSNGFGIISFLRDQLGVSMGI